MIDLHTHLLPAVDDGAATLAESVSALHALRSQGVKRVALTPHLTASATRKPALLASELARFDEAWEKLTSIATTWGPTLTRGVELMLDTPEFDLSDPRVRLGATGLVLLEFPGMQIPPRAAPVLRGMSDQGVIPLVAHPERYTNFEATPATLEGMAGSGAVLQVNLPSLVGAYGGRARMLAWRLLERGAVGVLASDYHARGRVRTLEAISALNACGAEEQVALLTTENPARLLAGERPLPVPPIDFRPSLWTRLIGSAG